MKFAEYLEAVRGLEQRIQQDEQWIDRPKPQAGIPAPAQGKGTEKDLKAMIELILLAIQTDSSRVFTLTSGFVNGDFGLSGGYHGFSHHGERDKEVAALKAIEGYQITMMAHLISLLKSQTDPLNGATLFDNTTILFGCGMATGQHTTRNLPILLASGGFRLGDVVLVGRDRNGRKDADDGHDDHELDQSEAALHCFHDGALLVLLTAKNRRHRESRYSRGPVSRCRR